MESNKTNIGEEKFELETKSKVYAALTISSSLLSIFGAAGIIAIFVCFKKLRTSGRRLLVYLSLMDAFTACGNILGVVWLLCRAGNICHAVYESMDFCRLHVVVTIFSSISSFLWMIIIGLSLVKSIVLSKPKFARKYMTAFHLICWPIPALVVIVALGFGVIGYDKNIASWCWIDPDTPGVMAWQFVTGKMWELSAYVLTVAMYTTVRVFLFKHEKKSVKESKNDSRKSALQEANRKLTFIPLVFIVLRMWGTLRFLLGSILHYDAEWISYLQGVGDSSQGFANFVLYCAMTDTVRRRVFAALCKRPNKPEMSRSLSISQSFSTTVDVKNSLIPRVKVAPIQGTSNT